MGIQQIILDTETTGIRVEEGHRIIEIGCIEMIDRKLTGRHFHQYINPEREIEAGALAVHGISNEFLKDKPTFPSIANQFMEFIGTAELIIHNAPFDISFLNNELALASLEWKTLSDYCRITCTLQIARKRHVGQRNSLDALCKRYGIDNSKREFHGALLDAHLLAQVYLAMTGGQGSFFDTPTNDPVNTKKSNVARVTPDPAYPVLLLKADADELKEHANYLENLKKQGRCYWLDEQSK